MIYAETSFDKAVDDALEEMSRKENKTMPFRWDDPKEPSATEDATSAIKRASEYLSDTLGKMKDDFPFLAYDDMYPEYGGRMRLEKSSLWESLVDTLICNGYEVTVRLDEATETEKEMDGASTFVVIEFDEVE